MEVGRFDLALFWQSLTMSFTPWWFFVFLAFVMLWYFALPLRSRWKVLLVASLAFCAIGGWQTVAAAVLVAFITWNGGIIIQATPKQKRKRRRLALTVVSLVLVAALAYVKLNVLYEWATAWFVVPVGMSYYTFSCISYLAEVYRGRQEAERSFFRMLLFVVWFPKILEGPIERYGTLSPQLFEGHPFDWNRVSRGAQLALWGYIKKMVIADRIAVLTAQAFGHSAKYGGLLMLASAMLAAVQLYCDFSGCMDIAGGISQAFGITLEQNFRQPFFSKSAAEFWRRWHITLGAWFKDYVYVPLTVSPRIMRVANVVKRHFGRHAGMHVMRDIPLVVVWLFTGLWHGTGENYLAWGAYWCVIILFSRLFKQQYARLATGLGIRTESFAWRLFQMARTFTLFSIGRIITVPGDLAVTGRILTSIVVDPRPWELVDKTILRMGLDGTNLNLLVVCLLLVWAVDVLHERGVQLRERIGAWNMIPRELVYAVAVLFVLVFGMYGPQYSAASFAYMNF